MTSVPLSQSYLLATGRYPLPSDEVSAFIWIPITEECPRGQALQNIATVSWKLNRRYCEIGFLLETEVGKGEELISGPRKPWRSWGPPHLETGVASHKSWYVTSLLHQEAHAVCGPSMSHSHNLSVLLIAVSSCSLHGAGEATDTGETSPPSTKKPTVISRHLWQTRNFPPLHLQRFYLFPIRTLTYWRETADSNSCFKSAEFKVEEAVSGSTICCFPHPGLLSRLQYTQDQAAICSLHWYPTCFWISVLQNSKPLGGTGIIPSKVKRNKKSLRKKGKCLWKAISRSHVRG